MLKRIKNALYRFFYALPFGLKGADNEILGSKDQIDGSNVTVQQKIGQKSLGEALIDAEVTQEVEELRYSTYKIAKESQNYEYLGDGMSIKKEKKQSDVFVLPNHIICEGIEHELNRLNDYGIDRYVLKVKYKDITRFKIEKYCNSFKVDLKNKEISLFFEKNTDNPERRMFLNELNNIAQLKKSDVTDYPTTISFSNEQELINYKLNDISYKFIVEEKFQYILTYTFKNAKIDDILKRYYSKTMDEKYQKKERKNDTISAFQQDERVRHCSSCGKEISVYDGDITEQSFGYPLCQDCLKKLTESLQ